MGLAAGIALAGIGVAAGIGSAMGKSGVYKAQAKMQDQAARGYDKQAEYLEVMAENEARWHELNAAGTEYQAMYLENMGRFNRDAAEVSALLAERDAAEKAHQVKKEGSAVMGRQVAGYGAANVEMSGTAMEVLTTTSREIERQAADVLDRGRLQATMIRLEGDMGESQYKAQAAGARMQGWADLFSADQARLTGQYNAYGARLNAWQSRSNASISRSQAGMALWDIPLGIFNAGAGLAARF